MFSFKSQIVNIFHSVGHVVSVKISQSDIALQKQL